MWCRQSQGAGGPVCPRHAGREAGLSMTGEGPLSELLGLIRRSPGSRG